MRVGKVIAWALVARDRITKENPRAKPILDGGARCTALNGGTSSAAKTRPTSGIKS
jgi:hypothetical protein